MSFAHNTPSFSYFLFAIHLVLLAPRVSRKRCEAHILCFTPRVHCVKVIEDKGQMQNLSYIEELRPHLVLQYPTVYSLIRNANDKEDSRSKI